MDYINKTSVGVKIPTELLESIDQMAESLDVDRTTALNLFLLEVMKDRKSRQMIYNRVAYLKRKNVVKYRSKLKEVTTVGFRMSHELYEVFYHIDKMYNSAGFSTLVLRVAYETVYLKGITETVIGRILDGKQSPTLY